VRRATGARHGTRQHGRAARAARRRDAEVVPRNACAVADGAAIPEGGDERGLRRPDRAARFRRRCDAPLLLVRGGAGGAGCVCGEAEAGLLEVPAFSMNAWVVAARPKTLSAAVVPVLVGTALAWSDPFPVHWTMFACALAGAIFIQIGTNFVNDALDFKKGADTAERLGPLRVTQAGLLSARCVRRGAGAGFSVAA